MKANSLSDELKHFFPRLTYSHTTREVRNMRSPARLASFNHYHVPHLDVSQPLRPACLRMAFNVPGGMSTPVFPATVTVPGFVGCLNCR